MTSSKPGTATSKTRLRNKRPIDPIDRLIHEHGLRIKDVYINKALDLFLLVLNNGQLVRSTIGEHARLSTAGQARLEKWQLIAGGTGLTWPDLDEDLSLRGFIQTSTMEQVLRDLSVPHSQVMHVRKRQARRA